MSLGNVERPDPDNPSAIFFRDIGDGRGIWIYPMLYTFKLVIGRIGWPAYEDEWCYKDGRAALMAASQWNPPIEKEPEGWVRHPPSGRRRFPNGDPATEEIRL
jgi:hypothetical protein